MSLEDSHGISIEEKAINDLNLKVLQRLYKDVDKQLFTSKCASYYEYDKATKLWHNCDAYGPLFVCTLKNKDYKKIILLNQKNNYDYTDEDIVKESVEINDKKLFMYYRARDNNVKGIWIYIPQELTELYKILTK